MKRFLSWFRRRLLVRVMVGTGVRLRAGDTVLVAVDGFLAEEQVASLRAAFEKNHPGVKVVFLAGLDRVVVLAGELRGGKGDDGRNDSGEEGLDQPVVGFPESMSRPAHP